MRPKRLLVILLVIAACTAGQDPALTASTTTTHGSTDGQPTGPSQTLLAFMFPISGAELSSTNYIIRSKFSVESDKIGECMRDQGFVLDFESRIPSDYVRRLQEYPAYDSLAKYGFNITEAPGFPPALTFIYSLWDVLEGLGELPSDLTTAEAQAIVDTYDDCSTEVFRGNLMTALTQLQTDYRELEDNFALQVAELDRSDPRIVSAFADFHRCVQLRGWELDLVAGDGGQITDDTPFFANLDGLMLREDDPDKEREIEKRAAVDYTECMAPVEATRIPLRTALRDEWIEDNLVDLIELEGRFRVALAELGVSSGD